MKGLIYENVQWFESNSRYERAHRAYTGKYFAIGKDHI
jgi:hypothetical protein